ncbi:hypothetical protein Bca52824_065120 [Brassica carinata]|uniref:Uncharacterized protein n=1 Tax=Brassica carinata TaxID=52824 RepID=A0A8X7QL48_BRACI|nr:hypothetical protein Bca52824_065120 [Brassica carinata]
MVILIDTKRRIDPARLGKGHEVQSMETRVDPTRPFGPSYARSRSHWWGVVKDVSAPEVEVQPSVSSTTLVRVVYAEPAPESMPPLAKRSIVVGLPAPSNTPTGLPKSRKRPSANPYAAKKRKCADAGPLPTKASSLGSASRIAPRYNQYTSYFGSIWGNSGRD